MHCRVSSDAHQCEQLICALKHGRKSNKPVVITLGPGQYELPTLSAFDNLVIEGAGAVATQLTTRLDTHKVKGNVIMRKLTFNGLIVHTSGTLTLEKMYLNICARIISGTCFVNHCKISNYGTETRVWEQYLGTLVFDTCTHLVSGKDITLFTVTPARICRDGELTREFDHIRAANDISIIPGAERFTYLCHVDTQIKLHQMRIQSGSYLISCNKKKVSISRLTDSILCTQRHIGCNTQINTSNYIHTLVGDINTIDITQDTTIATNGTYQICVSGIQIKFASVGALSVTIGNPRYYSCTAIAAPGYTFFYNRTSSTTLDLSKQQIWDITHAPSGAQFMVQGITPSEVIRISHINSYVNTSGKGKLALIYYPNVHLGLNNIVLDGCTTSTICTEGEVTTQQIMQM